jgi:hypothetical protein
VKGEGASPPQFRDYRHFKYALKRAPPADEVLEKIGPYETGDRNINYKHIVRETYPVLN